MMIIIFKQLKSNGRNSMTTVQELTDMLLKIENKNQRVVVSDDWRDVLADVVKLFQRRDSLVIEIDKNAYGGKVTFEKG